MKRFILVVFTAVLIFVISSCGKNKLTPFEKFVNDIYTSENKKITKYKKMYIWRNIINT